MKTILVADDQPMMRLIVTDMLECHPEYRVRVAVNGSEALALAHRYHPDLVLLDVEMPRMTGPEVCAALKAAPDTRDIPVLMMSGQEPGDVEGYAMMAGFDGFFAKPFTANVLLERMKELLGK